MTLTSLAAIIRTAIAVIFEAESIHDSLGVQL